MLIKTIVIKYNRYKKKRVEVHCQNKYPIYVLLIGNVQYYNIIATSLTCIDL